MTSAKGVVHRAGVVAHADLQRGEVLRGLLLRGRGDVAQAAVEPLDAVGLDDGLGERLGDAHVLKRGADGQVEGRLEVAATVS
ncbi:MAG: hypothetical protein U0325_12095 [Polyangiales bacterium]